MAAQELVKITLVEMTDRGGSGARSRQAGCQVCKLRDAADEIGVRVRAAVREPGGKEEEGGAGLIDRARLRRNLLSCLSLAYLNSCPELTR